MSQLQTLTPKFTPPVKPQVRSRPPVRPEAPASLYRCLIVSACEQRRAMLREAAAAQDWDPIVCDSAEEALWQVARHRLQMVMVDLEVTGRRTPDSFKDMTERLAGESGRLLILCGNEGDAAEEIWARQLAAWMYLPGVDDQSDVAMVCGEAKNVAQKLMDSKAAHEAPA